MAEQIIQIETVSPLELFGVGDINLEHIKHIFPKLRLIARGNFLKVMGEDEEVREFVHRFDLMMLHLERFGKMNIQLIDQIMVGEARDETVQAISDKEVLVHGPGGHQVKAITANQKLMVSAIGRNDMVFAIGPAGTGKTYTAVALAVRALKNKEVKRIVLTRPAVEAGENLGFLPGDLKEKLDPYLQPLYDALRDMLPTQKLLGYLEDNTTPSQMKMFLTRMGKSSKFIITGDITQIDLPNRQPSGLVLSMKVLEKTEGILFIMLDDKDVVRHKLVTRIIQAFRKHEESGNAKNQIKPTDDQKQNP